MALVPFTQWWERNYAPSGSKNRTAWGDVTKDPTFRSLLALGALTSTSGFWDANTTLVDTSKLTKTMATAAKPTQTQTNSALQTGLETAMKYIDQLSTSFNTIKGTVIGAARATPEAQPSPTAAPAAMSTQNMLLTGAIVVVVYFLMKRK